jgi:hypothetical protein
MRLPGGVSEEESHFKPTPLNKKTHVESLHYIGDGLPAPSHSDIRVVLNDNALIPGGFEGFSPIPARADHIHVISNDIQSYTPTWTNLTVGNAVVVAKWYKIGPIVVHSGIVTFGTSTSVTGVDFRITNLPKSPSVEAHGVCRFVQSGVTNKLGIALATAGANTLFFRRNTTGGVDADEANTSASLPFVWATADSVRWSITYLTDDL